MKTKLNLIALILLIVLSLSCTSKVKPKDFDYGRVENSKYFNSYFGFEIELPSNWVVQTKEQTDNLTKKGKDLVAGDDKNLKAVINASEINSANLLTVFKYEIGSPVDYNPNFMLVAENLKNAPGIKTGGDYLFQVRKLLKQSQVQYDYFDEDFKKETIDGQEFFLMNASLKYLGLQIKQVYYSKIINGFSLGIIISYMSEEQKLELDRIINSLKFNK